MQKLLLFCALCLTCASPVLAEDSAECSNLQTQGEMNICADQAFQTSDDALNLIWEDAKTNAENEDETGEKSKALLTSQRNWLVFRDSQCDFEGLAAEGGSLQPILISMCKTKLTELRINQLRTYVDGIQ